MSVYAGWTMSTQQVASNFIRQLQADIQKMTADLETADEGARKVLISNLKSAQRRLARELRAQRREDDQYARDAAELHDVGNGG